MRAPADSLVAALPARRVRAKALQAALLYRAPLPRTKLTSPVPAASFDGTIELPGRTLRLDGWRGMVGHNWGCEHAARWIWLHGIDFREDAQRGWTWRLDGCSSRGASHPGWQTARSHRRPALAPRRAGRAWAEGRGERRSLLADVARRARAALEAHVDTPPGSSARWRYTTQAPTARMASTT